MHSNLVKTRTWPYGTKYQAKVLEAHRTKVMFKGRTKEFSVLMIESPDVPGEGFVLTDRFERYAGIRAGDTGTITFLPGGPNGGHWDFKQAR